MQRGRYPTRQLVVHHRTMDERGVASTLERLWSAPVAVTAAHAGRSSGLIASTAVSASLLPESPRVAIVLSKANLTHDMVVASRAFALHLLAATPDDVLARSLELFRVLGMQSGHDVEKLAAIPHRVGVTGSPVLDEALCYVEAQVVGSLDGGDVTVVLADVVAAAALRAGEPLTIDVVRDRIPPPWIRVWEERRVREINEARRRRDSA
jgi:flavin reductase (DIM6/NTAB) family NADH-FMN oxidoreductase RutF